jgi:hypothetical protein
MRQQRPVRSYTRRAGEAVSDIGLSPLFFFLTMNTADLHSAHPRGNEGADGLGW